MRTVPYENALHERLRDPRYARGLLKSAFAACTEDGNWEAFGLLLRDIVSAHREKRAFAKSAKISRQHLYRLFGPKANPTLKTLSPVLAELGLRLKLSDHTPQKKRAA
jgi:DNA-binding phage protein